MDSAWISGGLGLLAGVLGAAIPLFWAHRRSPSRLALDAVSMVTAQTTVIADHAAEISRLKDELEEERRLNRALEGRVSVLEASLRQAGIDPRTV